MFIAMLLFFIFLVLIIIVVVKMINNARWNTPTWRGIIISALLGALPLYLFLCFLGYMGEERDDEMWR